MPGLDGLFPHEMSDQDTAASEALNTDEPTQDSPEVVTPEPEASESPPEQSESEADKVAKRMQKRIDKRTADYYRERAEKEQLASRIAALEARTPQENDPEPDVANLVEERAEALNRQRELSQKVNAVLKAGKGLADFDAACNAVVDELPCFDRNRAPTMFMEAVLELEAPAKVLHHIGSDPDLLDELSGLTQTQLIRRLDRIERDMSAAPKTSSAPKPLTPVKAVSAESGLASAKSDEEWARMRDKEIRERGRSR